MDADRLVEMLPTAHRGGVILVEASPRIHPHQDRVTLAFAGRPDRRIHVTDYEPLLDERRDLLAGSPSRAGSTVLLHRHGGAPKGVMLASLPVAALPGAARGRWLRHQNDTPFLLGCRSTTS